ncbi:MAG TPA: sugar phosphate isomerase/epimerase [Sumerlaeia bacterium]|nr:sugar phosphate isomerase/epimerase [Sumerlaeia bacterium]
MKFGVADYGMNVWYGGCFDIEKRLADIKEIGYEGTERLEANGAADAMHKAAIYRKMGMDFALCRGPDVQATIQWTAALGKDYVWVQVGGGDFDTFCRQANAQAEVCARWGLKAGIHNHLGSLVESQEETEEFLKRCPDCGLVFDTAHLAAAGGDCVEIAEKYADRIVALHLKDWLLANGGADKWHERGRFCELGAGNIGLDNAAVLRTVVEAGFDGWVHVEQDTHLQDSVKDLAISRQYLRDAGF